MNNNTHNVWSCLLYVVYGHWGSCPFENESGTWMTYESTTVSTEITGSKSEISRMYLQGLATVTGYHITITRSTL